MADEARIFEELSKLGFSNQQTRQAIEVVLRGLAYQGLSWRWQLDKIRQLFDLNLTDLGRLFGTSRQAVSGWLEKGVPAARKPKVNTVLNIAKLLERQLKPGRLPAVARRSAPAYGDLSILGMIETSRHDELLQKVRESFNWAASI